MPLNSLCSTIKFPCPNKSTSFCRRQKDFCHRAFAETLRAMYQHPTSNIAPTIHPTTVDCRIVFGYRTATLRSGPKTWQQSAPKSAPKSAPAQSAHVTSQLVSWSSWSAVADLPGGSRLNISYLPTDCETCNTFATVSWLLWVPEGKNYSGTYSFGVWFI